MTFRPLPDRRRAMALCAFAGLTVVTCAGLVLAAALAAAPAAVLPLIVVVAVGLPVAATWDLPVAVAVLRAARDAEPALDHRALSRLRARLAKLPETQHPLGL